MNSLAVTPTAPPFRIDADGSVRIGNSRVLLDVVIHAFQQGETPEGIVERFTSADLADVYETIAYYLKHISEVDEYLADRDREAAGIRRRIEERQGPQTGLRERLLASRATPAGHNQTMLWTAPRCAESSAVSFSPRTTPNRCWA
jgi:uncharacterized protein (DUF433 family)